MRHYVQEIDTPNFLAVSLPVFPGEAALQAFNALNALRGFPAFMWPAKRVSSGLEWRKKAL
jgi:hypothetical protein